MIFVPRPWQTQMIEHLVTHPRANLWADMGSGKTGAVLTTLELLKFADYEIFPALVIAPLRVARGVWPAELRKWDHTKVLRCSIISGSVADRNMALHAEADIYTVNYENLQWLIETIGERWPFKTVIADESTRLKGFRLRQGTKRAAALAKIARRTERWINLTGTPAPNGLKDLWGQNWFLDYGERLGNTWTAFKERWFDYDMYSMEMSPKQGANEQIHAKLRDITLSVQIGDWIDLRKPVVSTVYVDLPDKVRAKYKELEKKMYLELENQKEITALTAAALSTKCLQMAAGAVYHSGELGTYEEFHDEKINALESIIEEASGANIVIFYQFRHDAARIKKHFPYVRELKTAKDETDWNTGRVRLLLAHPQSAGHGLNLQFGGHHIVWFSLWWNLETYLQANERLGPLRQMQAGLDRPVYVYHVVAKDTVDDLVLERLETKRSVQDVLLAAMKQRMI